MERFGEKLDENDILNMVQESKAQNSVKKAEWAVKLFNLWLHNRQNNGLINGLHVFKPLDEMTASELNSQLPFFIFEVRKTNGEKYPSSTLRDLFQAIGYHLTQNLGKPFKIFTDPEFQSSRQALDAAMKHANKEGVTPTRKWCSISNIS